MLIPHLAKHLRDLYFGGNWTVSNLKAQLSDVSWQEAIEPIEGLNTIATLFFHINYFVGVASQVLDGGPLEGNDKLSFAHPPIQSEADWQNMQEQAWTAAERMASLIEQIPEAQLWEAFTNEKYGNYFRNIQGIIEHSHYHLGQLALIKKLVKAKRSS